jgi:hypothetical protein
MDVNEGCCALLLSKADGLAQPRPLLPLLNGSKTQYGASLWLTYDLKMALTGPEDTNLLLDFVTTAGDFIRCYPVFWRAYPGLIGSSCIGIPGRLEPKPRIRHPLDGLTGA